MKCLDVEDAHKTAEDTEYCVEYKFSRVCERVLRSREE